MPVSEACVSENIHYFSVFFPYPDLLDTSINSLERHEDKKGGAEKPE